VFSMFKYMVVRIGLLYLFLMVKFMIFFGCQLEINLLLFLVCSLQQLQCMTLIAIQYLNLEKDTETRLEFVHSLMHVY